MARYVMTSSTSTWSGQRPASQPMLPRRAFAKAVCDLIEGGTGDRDLIRYIRRNFRLVTR